MTDFVQTNPWVACIIGLVGLMFFVWLVWLNRSSFARHADSDVDFVTRGALIVGGPLILVFGALIFIDGLLAWLQ